LGGGSGCVSPGDRRPTPHRVAPGNGITDAGAAALAAAMKVNATVQVLDLSSVCVCVRA